MTIDHAAEDVMDVMVTGGRGMLGGRLVPLLRAGGHDVTVGSRSPRPGGRAAGEVHYSFSDDVASLRRTLDGIEAVVHLATEPRSATADPAAIRRLLTAAAATGVGHVVLVSIVGIDEHPFPYYRAKRAAEEVLVHGPVPWTIVRSTQFHELVGRLADTLRWGPVVAVPRGIRFQPVDAGVVAGRVRDLVAGGPAGRVPDLGGPEELDLASAVADHLRAIGSRARVVPLPMFGRTIAAFRRGDLLAPGAGAGGETFREHLSAVRRARAPIAPGPRP